VSVFGYGPADLALTRDGGPDLLTGPFDFADATPAGGPAGSVLSVSGLGGYATDVGTYTLTYAGITATDLAGNPVVAGVGSAVVAEPTVVTIAVADATGSEAGGDPVAFTLTRTGDLSAALTVGFAMDGTAALAADFGRADATVVIPAGQASAALSLQPVADDELEGDEVARVRVAAGAGYLVGAADVAEAIVADVVTPFVAAVDPVQPDPRSAPVDAVTVRFNRAAFGVGPEDFTLARDGLAVSLGGAVVVPVDAKTYTLSGLGAVTAAAGSYELRLARDVATVQDAGGNSLGSDAAEAWQTVSPPPPVVPTTVSLRSPADAFGLDGTNAGTNYGAGTALEVRRSSIAGNQREAFLRFDLSAVASASQITAATLRLYGKLSEAGSVTVGLYPVASAAWTEAGLSWNNRPAAGATAIGTKTLASTTSGWVEFDVTSYLKQQKAAGATSVSLALKATNYTTPWATFASDEATANRPELRVTQQAAAPAPEIVRSQATVTVAEGGVASAGTVRLSAQPAGTVTVAVARQSGDADLSATPAALVFTPQNWATPQPLTVSAAQDADAANGTATFALSAPGLATVTLSATEQDDDVVTPPPPPPTGGPTAVLIDAAADVPIATLTDGYVIDLAAVGTRLNVRALPAGSAGSIQFLIDGAVAKTETTAPYAIGGDGTAANGAVDYLDWTPPIGDHTLTVVQYAGAGATGAVQGTTALRLTVLPAGPTSPPPPPSGTPTTLRAVADATVRNGSYAAQNFGSATDLTVKNIGTGTAGYNRNAVLRFDLSAGPAAIASATLRLYGKTDNAVTPAVTVAVSASANTGWTESGVTWNAQPAVAGGPLATFGMAGGTTARWYEVNLTSFLRAERAAGRTLVTLVLSGSAVVDQAAVFDSDESTGNRPELVLV
ncbi:MAG: C-terminal target protein, partial [Phycisphaerales bacterium]|nr:C-terminal target protein [Phycisphaerales bacterium]